MNRYTLPSLLVATALFAGVFAFIPVEDAQAVHTTVQGTQMTQSILLSTAAIGTTDITCDSDAAFVVYVIVGNAETDGDTLTITAGGVTLTMTGDAFVTTAIGVPGFGAGYATQIAATAATTVVVGGSANTDDALVSLTTTSGATAGCV
ncbi:MAG: hypothetical protein IIA83_00225 [Thaumarchaeota archaeon]|nr:hypothetical protein [Nitrososphaerota archaeon]